VRAVITASGGVVFKTVGDAIYAALRSALGAVQAAVAGQRAMAAEAWGTSTALRVRMALHSGVVEERGGDYFGACRSRASPGCSPPATAARSCSRKPRSSWCVSSCRLN